MSIDTSDPFETELPLSDQIPCSPLEVEPWESLREQLTAIDADAKSVFGKSAKRGRVYRWGVAAASGTVCDPDTQLLSYFACDRLPRNRKLLSTDLVAATESFLSETQSASILSPRDAAHAVLWAAALPALAQRLEQAHWWRLLNSLLQLRESILQRSNHDAPAHLMLGGELGLTLSWRLSALPACKRIQSTSIDAVTAWCEREDESISAALATCTGSRLVLASLIRCRQIMQKTTRRRLGKRQKQVAGVLATWVAATTTHTGGTAFSRASRSDVADDLPPHGLLGQLIEFDPDALAPAVSAALGAAQTGGRLAWEVELPEAFHHDHNAKTTVMFPDWDVRRGRTHLDYSGEDVRIEVFAGRTAVIAGQWQTMIELDDEEQQACGDWTEVCEYTDDDVHYIEIEQPWTGGIVLQRQLMLLRDDRCLLLADAVLPSETVDDPPRSIKYASRLPLLDSMGIEAEQETREVFLNDGRRRGLVIPLSASEWRAGPSDASLKETADHHLLLSTQGRGSLYAPLWFDFQQRRFKRKRTWRQLTVVDQLEIVQRDKAVGYRVQVGSEQWMAYRSLSDRRCRSVLGKHIVAEFYTSRFDPSDGSHDALVTVDDSESADD